MGNSDHGTTYTYITVVCSADHGTTCTYMTVVLALLDWHWQVWAGGIDNGHGGGLGVRHGTT